MLYRHPKGQVDGLLQLVDNGFESDDVNAMSMLAAEVKALREELAAEKREKLSWMSHSAIYCATLERVEALPAEWESSSAAAYNHFDRAPTYIEQGMWEGFKQAAKQLRAELKEKT